MNLKIAAIGYFLVAAYVIAREGPNQIQYGRAEPKSALNAQTEAGHNTVTIENQMFVVRMEPASGRFSVFHKASQQEFVKDGRLSGQGGVVSETKVANHFFGNGEAILVSYPNGNRDAISLHPNVPFVFFGSVLHNGGAEATVTEKFQMLSAEIALGKAPGELRTLGTGGLLPPDKNPGSYAWLAITDPQSRNGVVGAWLTHERGSGVVFTKVDGDHVQLQGQIDYGRLRVTPGQTANLETFALGYFDDARLGLEAWADALAKINSIKLPPQPVGYCTWYSRPYGGASDETHLAELAAFATKNLAPFGFSVVQIDDGWQAGISTNGPKKNFYTDAPRGAYPSGMKAVADKIKAQNLVPGLWFMPFAGTYYDPFFKDHQDWFVKNQKGEPYLTPWGGTSLDLTRTEVRAYLRQNVQRIARDWGYQYLKMDGLWTGTATRQMYVNDGYKPDGMGDAVFGNPDETNIQAYRDGLKLIRETAGPGVFLLGCCTPQNMRSYGAAFGLVDAMRIGPDNGTSWTALLRGPTYGSRQYFLHGRVWYNDPDPLYVRPGLPLEQARLICSWVALSGQLNLSSEWLPGLPPERLDLLKRTMPSHGLLPRPADLFDEKLPRIWLLTDTRRAPRRDVVGLFNWDNQPYEFDYPLARIGLDGDTEYDAFEYWQNTLVPTMKGRLKLTVPARSCCVLAVRPRLDRPQLISTSRHITQGMVDVLEESWDAEAKVLVGRSKVVANDPYELRIAAKASGTGWKVKSAEISAEDRGAGASMESVEAEGLLRATLKSPTSREVSWRIGFRPDRE